MPCPFFVPRRIISTAELRSARLPLVEEYSGQCLNRTLVGEDAQSYSCNHGYALGICENFPASEKNSANRYSLLRRDQEQLDVLFIREEEYAPVSTRRLHYRISAACLLEQDLEPCIAAQAAAFCRSYLKLLGIRVTDTSQ